MERTALLDSPPEVSQPVDCQLLDRACKGDGDAFGRLVRPHEAALKRFLQRSLNQPEDVADVAQVVLVRASHRLATFKRQASLGTWLIGIARRALVDHFRRKRCRPDQDDSLRAPCHADLATQTDFPRRRLIANEQMEHCLGRIVEVLPLRGQLAILLSDVLELNAREAAAVLGMSSPRFRHVLHRTRNRLRQIVGGRCALIDKQGVPAACPSCREGPGTRHRLRRALEGQAERGDGHDCANYRIARPDFVRIWVTQTKGVPSRNPAGVSPCQRGTT